MAGCRYLAHLRRAENLRCTSLWNRFQVEVRLHPLHLEDTPDLDLPLLIAVQAEISRNQVDPTPEIGLYLQRDPIVSLHKQNRRGIPVVEVIPKNVHPVGRRTRKNLPEIMDIEVILETLITAETIRIRILTGTSTINMILNGEDIHRIQRDLTDIVLLIESIVNASIHHLTEASPRYMKMMKVSMKRILRQTKNPDLHHLNLPNLDAHVPLIHIGNIIDRADITLKLIKTTGAGTQNLMTNHHFNQKSKMAIHVVEVYVMRMT